VARVGHKPISLATVEHLMVLASQHEPPPDPPAYSACVARLKAAGTKSGASTQSEAQLKRSCQQHYRQLLQDALSKAIHTQWLIGEAAEEGIGISAQEVQQEFELSRKTFSSNAEFKAYRKSSGQTIADMMSEIKLGKLADKIFQKIKEKEHPASSTEVSAYYDAHRRKFAVPEGRDVRMIRTTTRAPAIKAKQEIQSGKSFATVAKEFSAIAQPITAKNGEVRDLKPELFQEKALKDSIFTARLNRLYGPVQVTARHKTIAPESGSGFFVFEVTRIIPASQTPLGQVRDSIARGLTERQKNQTLAGFIAAFRRKWTTRTDCRPGYVAQNCRQFKLPKTASPDPYTL
jgi:foldase protein PrsA